MIHKKEIHVGTLITCAVLSTKRSVTIWHKFFLTLKPRNYVTQAYSNIGDYGIEVRLKNWSNHSHIIPCRQI